MKSDVRIYATGSSSNCSVIDGKIMIDCGVPFSALPLGAWRRASVLIITHKHGDHLNPAVLSRICAGGQNPTLARSIYANRETRLFIQANRCLLDEDGNDATMRLIPDSHLLVPGTEIEIRRRSWDSPLLVTPFSCPHGDVECSGLSMVLPSGDSVIWATDTESMGHAPDMLYDGIFVEGNWDEEMVAQALSDPDSSLALRAAQNLRHLSVQDFEEFARSHRKPDSVVTQLHMSLDFGTRSPLNSWPSTVNA